MPLAIYRIAEQPQKKNKGSLAVAQDDSFMRYGRQKDLLLLSLFANLDPEGGYNHTMRFRVILGGGATLAAAAALGAYGSMAPRSELFGPTFLGDGDPTHLALTYDDGPNDPHTLRLLDVLHKHNVRATFFMIGRYVRQRPDIVREIFAARHTLANHTYTHRNLLWASPGELQREIQTTEAAIADAIGGILPSPRLFRPPWGARRPDTLTTLRRAGLIPVMWSVTCFDWQETTAQYVEEYAISQINKTGRRPRQIILLHDGGHLGMGADRSATVEATDRLVRRCMAEGRKFVTIPEMIAG